AIDIMMRSVRLARPADALHAADQEVVRADARLLIGRVVDEIHLDLERARLLDALIAISAIGDVERRRAAREFIHLILSVDLADRLAELPIPLSTDRSNRLPS